MKKFMLVVCGILLTQMGCVGGDGDGLKTEAPWDGVFTSDRLSTELKALVKCNGTCAAKREKMLQKSDAELFDMAIGDGVGNCKFEDARSCIDCFCNAYVQIKTTTWDHHGWALNPESRDSTGCVSTTCFPGYTDVMCTQNVPLNGVEQIRNALLDPNDVCGLCDSTRPITAEMILDSTAN